MRIKGFKMPVTSGPATPGTQPGAPTPNTPKGCNKRLLAMVGAGLATAMLVIFGIKQCSNKNAAYDERDAARAETEQVAARANAIIDSLSNVNDALDRARRDCNSTVNARDEEIGALNDSILALNDSLENAARQLQEARKPRQQRQPQRQPRRNNTQPRRGNTQPRQDVQNNPAGNNNTVRPVNVGDNNSGTVIVGDNNTVVVSASRATVNAAADTLKQHTVTITCQWIGTRRVK